jgi:hypothetical protein
MPVVTKVNSGVIMMKQDEQPSRDASPLVPATKAEHVFIEKDQYVSIEAHHATAFVNSNNVSWKILPDLGKTGSAITPFPVTAPKQVLSASSPHVAYEFYSYSTGDATLQLYFSPTLNIHHTETGLQYTISIDDENPQIVNLNADDSQVKVWEQWVANNIIIKKSKHTISKPGKHTIKFWMIHPGIVLQKLVLDFGGVKPSYLGPPESTYKSSK